MNYSEIIHDILTTLEQDPDVLEGDIYDQVVLKLKPTLYEIVTHVWPEELLTLSSSVTVTSDDTTLSITTDFGITDLLRPFALMVNEDPTNTSSNALAWKYVNPKSWIKYFNRLAGTVQPQKSYTILSDAIILNPWPSDTNTYSVGLWYYKDIAAVTDAGEPELPKQHHSVLVYGVAQKFPHLFAGDRLGLFSKIIQDYSEGLKALINDVDASSADYTLTLAPTLKTSATGNGNINWGGLQSSDG